MAGTIIVRCFAALREYFSLLPERETASSKIISFKDRISILICYLSIPAIIYIAYIEWYKLFIIFIPVYIILLLPIVFVLENRTDGSLKSLAALSLGLLFFVHNLGHCLFMITFGAIVLMFCFTLTEVRDLLSYWIGKSFAGISRKLNDGFLRQLLEKTDCPGGQPKKNLGSRNLRGAGHFRLVDAVCAAYARRFSRRTNVLWILCVCRVNDRRRRPLRRFGLLDDQTRHRRQGSTMSAFP